MNKSPNHIEKELTDLVFALKELDYAIWFYFPSNFRKHAELVMNAAQLRVNELKSLIRYQKAEKDSR